MENFDVVVIGAGPGGYPAAIRAAQNGAAVAIVEREKLGGTCLNWGCIPTKTLIASSNFFAQVRRAEEFGIMVEQASADYAAMIARKDRIVGTLRNGVEQLLKANGVAILSGCASFVARNRLAIKSSLPNSEPRAVGAGKTIIATGARSSLPSFLPTHFRIKDSRSFLDLTACPSSVLVLGGGVIGCEFACFLAQLGVRVTVVEILEDILWTFDPDIRQELRRSMEKDLGIRIHTGTALEEITASSQGVHAKIGNQTIEANLLLAALGRKPEFEDLKLKNAGLDINGSESIRVDEYGRTGVATIYAIGDVTGGPQLAHAATAQGLVAADNACGKQLRKNDACVPSCVFTAPEIATAGLSELEANKQGRAVKVGKFPWRASGKALALGEARGFVKWIADAESGQLLGAQAVGVHATELIAEATAAIQAELSSTEICRTVHAHPTLAEAWLESAHVLEGKPIHTVPKPGKLKRRSDHAD